MTAPLGLLFVFTVSTAERLPALDHWYDTEHAEARMSLPGFITARRYRELAAPGADPITCFAYYDMDAPAVLDSATYVAQRDNPDEVEVEMLVTAVHIDRLVYEQLPTGDSDPSAGDLSICGAGLECRFYDTPPTSDWLAHEYPKMLGAQPGVLRLRRFRIVDGPFPKYLDMIDVESVEDSVRPGYRELSERWRSEVGPVSLAGERFFSLWRRFDGVAASSQ